MMKSSRQIIIVLLVMLLAAVPLAAQSVDTVPGLASNIAITFEDDFEAGSIAASWWVWDHFPQVVEGRMVMPGWNSWNDAIVRPEIGDSEGVLQLFRYEPGSMEFFLDFAGYEEPDYRNIRLGTAGNHDQ